ncbi:MAG: 3'-5' exonuclease domain-containing protein 2 [Bacteroidales bacterium]|nr:3'-5' exonuclease domain-containing protein 2 [Bacteroidales bacterium]
MNKFGFKENITHDEINQLPVTIFQGDIHVINTTEELDVVANKLQQVKVLGFDTETKPTFKKGKFNKVSLLQLSTDTDVYLIRLLKVGLNEKIAQILSDPGVVKVGAAIHDDIKTLQHIRKFEPHGFVELQTFVKDFGIEDNGLKKLAANILQIKISKRQQTSNWEAPILTKPQREYAATDAWVCLEIYNKLKELV